MRKTIAHRTLTAALMLTLFVGVTTTFSVCAQENTLVIAGYGGTWEAAMRKGVFPAFEAKYDVKVQLTAGSSTDSIARVQAQRDAQPYDIMFADDGPMNQAVQMGLCAKLEGLDKKSLYPSAVFPNDMAVAYNQSAVGLMYNAKYFQDRGWPAPTSWKDLSDPKYKGKLIVPPLSNTYGLMTLLMFARMNGGSERNIDPGFKTLERDVAPDVIDFVPMPSQMNDMFRSGQVVIAPNGSGFFKAFADTGFPVKFVYPKEGVPLVRGTMCLVAKPNRKPWASQFINYVLSPQIQTFLAKEVASGPVNIKVDPNIPQLGVAPVGKRAQRAVIFDWAAINAARPQWNQRWNREVER
ncbi:ABC transporter substrate-binding protein [Paraburkholderia caledonica]|uniref:Spermidine/putrescine transport system substrate-binding protein n=1 Tax=Paraburkholderia caledonica TaxID=134536 RepID=A0AB73IM04_9BURK|nr:putative spermidine/putrescine transport system substrate-binding protein [Paraburkholderia caledonica]